MKQYLLSIYQPDGPAPEPEVLDPIMKNLAAWNDELREAGAWVFSAGLHPPATATVLQSKGDELSTSRPLAIRWRAQLDTGSRSLGVRSARIRTNRRG